MKLHYTKTTGASADRISEIFDKTDQKDEPEFFTYHFKISTVEGGHPKHESCFIDSTHQWRVEASNKAHFEIKHDIRETLFNHYVEKRKIPPSYFNHQTTFRKLQLIERLFSRMEEVATLELLELELKKIYNDAYQLDAKGLLTRLLCELCEKAENGWNDSRSSGSLSQLDKNSKDHDDTEGGSSSTESLLSISPDFLRG